MAYKNQQKEKEYQKQYHKNYKTNLLQDKKDKLKEIFKEYDNAELILKEYIQIFGDLSSNMKINQKFIWYDYLFKYLFFYLES